MHRIINLVCKECSERCPIGLRKIHKYDIQYLFHVERGEFLKENIKLPSVYSVMITDELQ